MSESAVDLILDHLAALTEALDGMADLVADLNDEDTAVVRVALDDVLTKLRGAIYSTDQRLIHLLDVGQSIAAPGGGQIIVEAKGKQSTYGARLANRLASHVADKKADEDGVPIPAAVQCFRTAQEIVAVFGLDIASTSFRRTELKKRGLVASEFCEFSDGEPKVRFVR